VSDTAVLQLSDTAVQQLSGTAVQQPKEHYARGHSAW
jgi:hypothetical protein